MVTEQLVIVLDFGGQYNQLIARRVREKQVYCEVLPYDTDIERIKEKAPKGIIFTGGPSSVNEEETPKVDPKIYDLDVPILGICYGAQLMASMLDGRVAKPNVREYGKNQLHITEKSALMKGVGEKSTCWMSHTDYIEKPPSGFVVTAKTEDCPVAAMENPQKKLYGVQFHPEVEHTEFGAVILENFLYDICGLDGDWTMGSFAEEQIQKVKEQVGGGKVLCALSGGVDSSVAAALG
ncbi:MAG TPA: GMP synthase (glutamine-hydrolyzing), partial [Eubacteriaceae bacterium]|nr:GMP synthase (glutamine-hydrolyzing) [Eubacteriaceae bacterium]